MSPQNAPNRSAAPIVITMDGPGGAGKTAVGRRLARELGYRFLDTGVLYRAVTLKALEAGLDLSDAEALAGLAHDMRIELGQRDDGSTTIVVDGEDVTARLRDPEIDRNVSIVSPVFGVRQAVLKLQRELAKEGGIVMVGRDIGTVVLPEAPVKFYLDASTEERARRRVAELSAGGVERPFDEVHAELADRDRRDTQREHSPLMPAADAEVVNTDALSEEQVFQLVFAKALARA
jgi:CMP/dCMP kinase